MTDTNDNLARRWAGLCGRMQPGAESGASGLLWHILRALYAWPAREYHTLDHIAAVLLLLDDFRTEAAQPDKVEFALFLHDAVYVPGRTDNEARSADAAAMMLHHLGGEDDVVGGIRTLILATSHASVALNEDAELIADVDLAILGAPEADYDRYAQQVAAEYAFAGEQAFREGRRRFLESLLAQPAIFRRGALAARFEGQARRNIQRELGRLR